MFITKTEVLFFLICAIVIFGREFSLSTLTFHFFIYSFIHFFIHVVVVVHQGNCWEFGFRVWVTSSTTGVSDVLASDVLASVEREERNVRLGENSVIGTSVEGRKTSSSLSGKNDSRGEEATFAQEAERKPGRSAGSSRSKSSSRDVSH